MKYELMSMLNISKLQLWIGNFFFFLAVSWIFILFFMDLLMFSSELFLSFCSNRECALRVWIEKRLNINLEWIWSILLITFYVEFYSVNWIFIQFWNNWRYFLWFSMKSLKHYGDFMIFYCSSFIMMLASNFNQI